MAPILVRSLPALAVLSGALAGPAALASSAPGEGPGPLASDPCGTWAEVPSPDPADVLQVVLRDVKALAPDDVWSVGDATFDTGSGVINVTHAAHFDGSAWSIVPTPCPRPGPAPDGTWCDLDGVDGVAPDDVWAGGSQRIQHPVGGWVGSQALVLHWDGRAWSVVPAPLTPDGATGVFVRDVLALAADDVWFAGDWIGLAQSGNTGRPGLAMRWNGTDFELHPTPQLERGGTGLEALDALAPDDIWAVGGGGDGDWTAVSTIFHWDGSAWEHRPGPAPGFFHRLYAVDALAPDDVWAVGEYQDASGLRALVLHWDGAGWTQLPGPAGSAALLAFGPRDVYTSGAGIHHWDGSSWSLVEAFPAVVGPSAVALGASGPCELWTVGRKIVDDRILSFTARIAPLAATRAILRDRSLTTSAPPPGTLAALLPLVSPEDDYLAGATSGVVDPEGVVADPSARLVFYAVDSDTAVLRMVTAGASVRLTWD